MEAASDERREEAAAVMAKSKTPGSNESLHSVKEREALWQAVLQTARDAIVSIDGRGIISVFNVAAEEMFGYAASEVLGKNVSLLMPAPYRDKHDQYIRQYQRTGVAKAIGRIRLVAGRRKSGEVFPIELSIAAAHAPEDEELFTAIIRDVTHQQLARAELEVHARQQAAVAELGTVALTQPLADTLRAAVELVAATLGLDFAKILQRRESGDLLLIAGVGWRDGCVGTWTVGPEGHSQARFTLQQNATVIVEDFATETRFPRPPLLAEHAVVSGMSVIIGPRTQPFGVLGAHALRRRQFSPDDANFLEAIANVLAASIERTAAEQERRRLEELAVARARLAEIGALTAKVVHDFGNPLAALSMQAQLLRRRLEQGGEAEKMQAPVERILATVARLDELANDLSSFSREQKLHLSGFDVHVFLAELVDLWTPVAASRDTEIVLAEPIPSVMLHGDRIKLQRVFENLIKNAIEAVDSTPGTVTISCRLPDSDTVCICIEDNGRGIEEGFDVFRLFETTKAEGTGLGLSVARQIVMAHEGSIEHSSRDPQGTEFCVTLPLAGPDA